MNVPWILMSRGAVTLHKQEHDKKKSWAQGMSVWYECTYFNFIGKKKLIQQNLFTAKSQ